VLRIPLFFTTGGSRRQRLAAALSSSLVGIYLACLLRCGFTEEADAKIGGFRFYITDEDGKQRGVVNGYKADFLSPDEIQITDASAQLSDMGKKPVLIQTPVCTFIKSKSEIVSQNSVFIKTEGIEISGTGMQWSLDNRTLIIEKDVTVEIERILPIKAKTEKEKK
jgi:hypothetical protein